MKKFFKRLLVAILVLVVLFLVVALFVPKDYTVVRSVEVKSSKQTVYNYMGDLESFNQWSPWAEMDPDMKIEMSGTSGEVGSLYKWEGNDDVGKGSMEIIRMTSDSIVIKLLFIEPFESESITYYAFEDLGETTKVTWGMSGSNAYPWNLLTYLMGMKKMIGDDFDKGLTKLADNVSKLPAAKREFEIEEIDFETRYYVGIKRTVPFDSIAHLYHEHLPLIYAGVLESGYDFNGAASGLFFKWDPDNGRTEMAAAVPITKDRKIAGYDTWKLGGKALQISYYGDYAGSEKAHYAMEDYLNENKLIAKSPVIEEYVTDPMTEPDTSKWLTNIYYLLE